ncbi:MAG: WbqC family protein [Nitrospirota bacterium]
MIVAAHQPLFIPWIGYFDKINKVDLFVIVDNVQFTTAGWIRRNTIKGSLGAQRLIVPVKDKKHTGQLISDVLIDNDSNPHWRTKHLKTFIANYGRAPYFEQIIDLLNHIYSLEWKSLSRFNIELINGICSFLDIHTQIVFASDKNIQGGKTDLIIDICEKTDADTFMLGMGGSLLYADRALILSKGIKLVSQNFRHPEYRQLYEGFLPNLSVLDLLFNMGPQSGNVIRSS